MFFMGVGSFLSKYVSKNLFDAFIVIEIVLGFFGGISATALYISYSYTQHYYLYNFLFIAVLGTMIGIEIPIVARIINKYTTLKETVAKVFSVDYIGALAASVLFPLVLLPLLGVIKTALVIGIINLFIAFYNAWFFRKMLNTGKYLSAVSGFLILVFSTGIYFSSYIDKKLEQKIYQDKIIFSTQTKYQKIVLTRWNDDYRLFINGSIQFSSTDEYRYHESLVHLPLTLSPVHEKILVLGGGDGMVIREILKYKNVKEIHLVDLDPQITELAKESEIFTKLNQNSLHDKRVKIFNMDAYNFIKESSEVYSAIIMDLPDPNDTGLGKLYTKEFYEMLSRRLDVSGIMVTQATSPYFANKAYWCTYETIKSVFKKAVPYQANVPTFGIWGFVMAGGTINKMYENDSIDYKIAVQNKFAEKIESFPSKNKLKFLTAEQLPSMLYFEPDTRKNSEVEINTLSTQILVYYYNNSAEQWR